VCGIGWAAAHLLSVLLQYIYSYETAVSLFVCFDEDSSGTISVDELTSSLTQLQLEAEQVFFFIPPL